jgi:hypothetical protein
MHSPLQFVPEHRLKRFHRWAMSWLKDLAALLDSTAILAPLAKSVERIGHAFLDDIEHFVLVLVMLRATPYVRRAPARKRLVDDGRKLRGIARALMGSRIRRQLRPKDLRARIEALSQDIDVLTARLLRRLPCGFTRRRPIQARREQGFAAPPCITLVAPACADTS